MTTIRVVPSGAGAVVHLPAPYRRAVASILADWLNIYAGMSPTVLRREHFDLVIELRRLLLVQDERSSGRAPPGTPTDVYAEDLALVS